MSDALTFVRVRSATRGAALPPSCREPEPSAIQDRSTGPLCPSLDAGQLPRIAGEWSSADVRGRARPGHLLSHRRGARASTGANQRCASASTPADVLGCDPTSSSPSTALNHRCAICAITDVLRTASMRDEPGWSGRNTNKSLVSPPSPPRCLSACSSHPADGDRGRMDGQ